METRLITLRNVSKSFHEHGKELHVLKDIDLEFKPGEFFVFLGPSGSGKSTILRIMSGLEKDYIGTVERALNLQAGDVSFVFQQFALLPWLTVFENAGMGLIDRGLTEHDCKTRIDRQLKDLGLEGFAHSYPHELSGGMRQRVGLARAFATEPKVILMDEPFSEVDSFTSRELRKELLELWKKKNPTIIMVTHLIHEAIELADRIAVLTPRPGRIEKIIENRLPHPRNIRSEASYRLEDELYALIKP